MSDDWYPDQRRWDERFLSGFFPGICLCLSPVLIIAIVLWLN